MLAEIRRRGSAADPGREPVARGVRLDVSPGSLRSATRTAAGSVSGGAPHQGGNPRGDRRSLAGDHGNRHRCRPRTAARLSGGELRDRNGSAQNLQHQLGGGRGGGRRRCPHGPPRIAGLDVGLRHRRPDGGRRGGCRLRHRNRYPQHPGRRHRAVQRHQSPGTPPSAGTDPEPDPLRHHLEHCRFAGQPLPAYPRAARGVRRRLDRTGGRGDAADRLSQGHGGPRI